MAMKCPTCGNEVSHEEAFCGQCGTPITPPAPARPTMVNTPTPRSGLLNANNTNMSPAPSAPGSSYNPGTHHPSQTHNTGNPMSPGGPLVPPYQPQQPIRSTGPQQPQQPIRSSDPQQQTDFYQDATEAMSLRPNNQDQGYPAAYQQPGFTSAPEQGGYAGSGQFGPQPPMPPLQTRNYAGTNYPQAPRFPTGQDYDYRGVQASPTPPPQKQQTNGVLVVAIVCLIVAIITVSAFGAIYLLRGRNTSTTDVSLTATPLPTSAITPTEAPSPTATDTPTPVPSPTVAPTPTADPGFTWCNQTCTNNGFITEYPQSWNQQTPNGTTIQYVNSAQAGASAGFKTPGPTTSTANELVNNDLQTNFSSQPGYKAPTSTSAATIGGENWISAIAHFQSNGQKEQIEVFATVHQGKAYIIELQAPESQFQTVYAQYFNNMISKFQFQQSTS